MGDILKSIFNPAKTAQGASGQLGGLQGAQGRRWGHLGAASGDLGASQEAFNPTDHFDVSKQFNPSNFYDPSKLVKRY
jgi:hypothetical protein